MLRERLNAALPQASGKNLAIFLLLVLLVKSASAAFNPIFFDEAYYRIWAQDLQWGYYDHPPMIAYWIHAGHWLAGETFFGTRILPIIASILVSIGTYLLAREFEVPKILARQAAVWVQAIWMTALGSMIAVPDAPTTFFWVFGCLCAVRGARLNHTGWWLAAGGLAGLACLSKYTAFFLAPSLFLWLVTSPQYRVQLTRPGPWLAFLMSILVFLPNFVWNAAHDWVTFTKQLGRAAPEGFNLLRPVKFLLEQILLISPIIMFLACKGGMEFIGHRVFNIRYAACKHFIVCVSLPVLAYFLFHGLHSETYGHWTTPLYPGLALLAVLTLADSEKPLRDRIDVYVLASAMCIMLMGGALYAYVLFHDFHADVTWNLSIIIVVLLAVIAYILGSLFTSSQSRYFVLLWAFIIGVTVEAVFLSGRYAQTRPQALGQQELAAQAIQLATRHNADWLGANYHRTYAHLRDHIGHQTLSAQISDRFRYPPNDPSWRIDVEHKGLIVESEEVLEERDFADCFERVEKIHSMQIHDSSGYKDKYYFYIVSDPVKNWLEDGC